MDQVILTALREDLPYLDVTTDYLVSETHQSRAYLVAKEEGVLCGMPLVLRTFELLGGLEEAEVLCQDGTAVRRGDILARFSGRTSVLLKGERTALNLLQHLSGIASMTARCTALTVGTKAQITDTRKTLPGLRSLQKYAVTVGGGKNHRMNLSDGAMLKDNHIDAYGGIAPAVEALRSRIGHMVKIEVEVRNFEELEEALDAGADIIMLDNMSPDQMREAVRRTDGRVLLEASGNISEQNLAAVAATGVDIISLGALTHSVKCFDISMKIETRA